MNEAICMNTVVSSLVSDAQMTQAGLLYLCTSLEKLNLNYNLIDLSGMIDYFDAPSELYQSCKSNLWLNIDAIKEGNWMDNYMPDNIYITNGYVFFSSLFSPDLVFHSRISYKIKTQNKVKCVIGGSALNGLTKAQLEFLSCFFDYILIGYNVYDLIKYILNAPEEKIISDYTPPNFSPNYSLLQIKDFVNLYTGHGCYYGKCSFCDYPARSSKQIFIKPAKVVAEELNEIYKYNPSVQDIVLTQDCYSRKNLCETIEAISSIEADIPYNLMLRAEKWINTELGIKLQNSNCTDVFIGVEALDNSILKIINKGIDVNTVVRTVESLSNYVDLTIGMILFIPNVSKTSLDSQLSNLRLILPYISHIEPEVLTVVNGSEFHISSEKYGIELYATKNLLNDSWCFGLSNDIPYTIVDKDCIRNWCDFIVEFKKLCNDLVRQEYWEAIESIISNIDYIDSSLYKLS